MYSEKITWTTGNGSTATVKVEVCECANRSGNPMPGTAELSVSGYIDGNYIGSGIQKINHPVAVAKIGRLGITREHYDRINAAIAEARQDPDLAAYEAACAKAEAERAEYEAHYATVCGAMAGGERHT